MTHAGPRTCTVLPSLPLAAISTDHGVSGDHAFAVIDGETGETGEVASAKQPRRWGALLDCRAEFTAPPAVAAFVDVVKRAVRRR